MTTETTLSTELAAATGRRRTFAIISHPDAGKTTLTEKLLLYSGLIRTAGMVRGRKGGKATASDWMGMEQERGISITASAMQFPYKGAVINLLDTPGHQDFSEDTYRTLTAADSAIMVIDAAKGVETQTRKLFAVCRLRRIPVLTLINKMDQPGRPPLDLMTEVEQALNIHASAVNWPIGSGSDFVGIVTRADNRVQLFSKTAHGGAAKVATETLPLAELGVTGRVSQESHGPGPARLGSLRHRRQSLYARTVSAGRHYPGVFCIGTHQLWHREFFGRVRADGAESRRTAGRPRGWG